MFELEFAARVDRGLVRETNQDVARVVPWLGLALVADGMGGHDRGDVASRAAADVLEQRLARLGGAGTHAHETAERLQASFAAANLRMAEQGPARVGLKKMGTTLVAAVFAHGQAVIANVGDSRCYRLRHGVLEVLTKDHSFAAQFRESGLTAAACSKAAFSQWAHVLTRCLNGDEGMLPDIRAVRSEPGDIYVLCSDGVWGTVANPALARVLQIANDAEDACERLVGAAWAGGGLDNIGVAVVRLSPLQHRLDKPSYVELPAGSSGQLAGNT